MKLVLLPALALLISVTTLRAQWVEANRKQSQSVKGNGALIVHDGTMYFWNEENHFQMSSDNGATWSDPPDGISGANPHVVRMSATGDRVYAALNFGTGQGMPIYSSDRGVTWQPDTVGAPAHALGWGGLPVVSDIYAWGGKWVYVKWDQPNTPHHIKTFDGRWTPNVHMSTGGNNPTSVVAKGDTLFAAGSKVYYTVDGGATWITPANAGLTGFLGKLFLDGHRIYMFAFTQFGRPATLFYTDDNAESWKQIDVSALMNRRVINGDPYFPVAAFFKGNRIEFATALESYNSPPNVWRSTDLGTTWERDTAGLRSAYAIGVMGFAYTNDGTLWVVPSHENIYRQKIDGGVAGVRDRHVDLPYTALRVHPNPMGSSSAIELVTPVREHLRVSIADARGATVALLHDGVVEAGAQRLVWDREGVAAGLYLLRVQCGSRIATRQIIVR